MVDKNLNLCIKTIYKDTTPVRLLADIARVQAMLLESETFRLEIADPQTSFSHSLECVIKLLECSAVLENCLQD
jgi:hypothetical protein